MLGGGVGWEGVVAWGKSKSRFQLPHHAAKNQPRGGDGGQGASQCPSAPSFTVTLPDFTCLPPYPRPATWAVTHFTCFIQVVKCNYIILWMENQQHLPGVESSSVSQVAQVVKNPPANAGDIRDVGFDPCVGKIPWKRAWQPTPVFLPGECHRQSLEGYSP